MSIDTSLIYVQLPSGNWTVDIFNIWVMGIKYYHPAVLLKRTYASGMNLEYHSYNSTLFYFSVLRAIIGLHHCFE